MMPHESPDCRCQRCVEAIAREIVAAWTDGLLRLKAEADRELEREFGVRVGARREK
jgi:hypothetical protein